MKLVWLLAFAIWGCVAVWTVSAFVVRNNTQLDSVPNLVGNKIDNFTVTTKNEPVILMLAGDLMPGRTVNTKLREIDDFDYPFVNNLFAGADLVFLNLESPIIENCPNRYDGFKFCADLRIVPAMRRAGINIVNLANNHIGNEALEGIRQTKQTLQTNQIQYTGTDEDVILEINGLRLGFLGFNDVGECPVGIDCAKISNIEARIAKLSQSVDFVVVQFHWGVEYVNNHSKRQQTLAYAAIDAGADLVFGAHPHWVQGIENYKEKMIFYSLGNFLFDQQWSKETQEGVVVRLEIDKKMINRYEILPIIIDKSFQPRWAEGEDNLRIRRRMSVI